MKDVLTRLRALLRAVELPAEAGPLPLAASAMLGNEWLAPHLVRLPVRARGTDRHGIPGPKGKPFAGPGRSPVGEAYLGAPPQTPPKG